MPFVPSSHSGVSDAPARNKPFTPPSSACDDSPSIDSPASPRVTRRSLSHPHHVHAAGHAGEPRAGQCPPDVRLTCLGWSSTCPYRAPHDQRMNHYRQAMLGVTRNNSRRPNSHRNGRASGEDAQDSRSNGHAANATSASPARRSPVSGRSTPTSQESSMPPTPPNPALPHNATRPTSPDELHPARSTPTYRPFPTPTATPPTSNATSTPKHPTPSTHSGLRQAPGAATNRFRHHDPEHPQAVPSQPRPQLVNPSAETVPTPANTTNMAVPRMRRPMAMRAGTTPPTQGVRPRARGRARVPVACHKPVSWTVTSGHERSAPHRR